MACYMDTFAFIFYLSRSNRIAVRSHLMAGMRFQTEENQEMTGTLCSLRPIWIYFLPKVEVGVNLTTRSAFLKYVMRDRPLFPPITQLTPLNTKSRPNNQPLTSHRSFSSDRKQ
jgi:hypothetical protein